MTQYTITIHDDGAFEVNESKRTNQPADGKPIGPSIALKPWRHEVWHAEVMATDAADAAEQGWKIIDMMDDNDTWWGEAI